MTTATSTYLDAIRHMPAGGTLTIPGVSWDEYEALLAELEDNSHFRLTYDEGSLEIVSPSTKHEWWNRFIADVARVLATELGTELEGYGHSTIKKKSLQKGAEPDSCFYVQNAARVIGKQVVDLAIDPPDIVVEVDVSHSSTRKLAFYAQLGVPEVWRYDGRRAVFYRLGRGQYVEIPSSLAFAGFAAATLTALLSRIASESQQRVLNDLRRTLRDRA
ncbi:MAG: Uma2 family endonuclease [Acidobacteria bacterium]|nr:Uma2 family endonuclease [Acidobacteriota bacterium]